MFDFFDPKFNHLFYSKNLCNSKIEIILEELFINKPSHDKIYNILHKFLNKTNNQI